ncbi:SMP-30/gluconolactonase/LRE family protein [Cryobacterium sp. Y62]|uniref:SMP-30/gluconolactonase/LRE family protein n=1 Tax=Cryobacterium sp. Y62 TaxID=2048284 RepID=UPI000CE415D6|nr:SMP-30/gluconolactonase/LRE family protein [Cryobacterium sp. Y62]
MKSDGRNQVCVAANLGFTEGPVVSPSGEILVTSISDGGVYRVSSTGADAHFTSLGGGANGAVIDRSGTIFVAQNGGRWASEGPSWMPASVGGVQKITLDGTVSWLTRDPIAPNDLCFGPDGFLYVTDPTRSREISDGRIWRVDPQTGSAEILLSTPWFPNGIAFDAENHLYLASTNDSRIYRADVVGRTLSQPELAIQMTSGYPDGMAFDESGNLVIGAISLTGDAGTIQTWTSTGKPIDEYSPGTGSFYTNVAFTPSGSLVITASDLGEVLVVHNWGASGMPLHPFR